MKVSEYLALREITPEELSALLSERLSRSIAVGAVISRSDKDLPKSWVEALGDVPNDPPNIVEEVETAGIKDKPKRTQTAPPRPTPTAEFNPILAEERVAAIYAIVGKGVASATKEPRYEKAFYDHADKCGKAWAELAKHDKHVATVLTMLTTGGPWGEVIWLHLSLGFSLVVISGKVDIGFAGGLVPGAPVPPPPTNGAGSGTAGASDSVAEASG